MKRCRKCKVPLEGIFSVVLKNVLRCQPSEKDPSLCHRCAQNENKRKGTYICQICDRGVDEASALTHIKAEEYLLGLIKKDHPEWKADKETCPECIAYYRELIKKAKI
jgi:protein-arginine kinase activator protein McsA